MPSFMRRLSAAFVSSSLVFLAIFLSFTLPQLVKSSVGSLALVNNLTNGLDSLAVCLAIIFVAMFVIAYPAERWLIKKRSSAQAAVLYALIMFLIGLVCWLIGWALKNSLGTSMAVIAIMSFVGGAVAFVARLLYPQFLKVPKITYVLAIALVITGLLGPAIPTTTKNAPVGAGIFPELANGELARGTWNLNPKNGSMGTYFYNPNIPIDPSKKYELSFACITPRKPVAYTALIRNDKNLKQFVKHNFKCFGSKTIHFAVDFGGRNFDPQVMLYPTDSRQSGNALDAWAILAPVGAVK
jgi:acid phosphatase family membrane protein YuiD